MTVAIQGIVLTFTLWLMRNSADDVYVILDRLFAQNQHCKISCTVLLSQSRGTVLVSCAERQQRVALVAELKLETVFNSTLPMNFDTGILERFNNNCSCELSSHYYLKADSN